LAGGIISQEETKEIVRKMGFPANFLPFKNAFGNETLFTIENEEYYPERMADFLTKVGVGSENLAKFYAQNEPQPQPHIPVGKIT
jgi:hypothetical protein